MKVHLTVIDQRLWQALTPARGPFAFSVTLSLLNGIVIVVQALLLSQIINAVFLEDKTLSEVQTVLGLLVVAALVRWFITMGASKTAQTAAHTVISTLRRALIEHIIALGPTYTAREHSGELTHTLTDGVEELDQYLRLFLPRVFTSVLIPLLIVLIVFPIDILSAVVLVLTAPLLPVFMVLIGMWAGAVSQRQWRVLSFLSAHFLDVLQGLTTLKLFNRSRSQIKTIGRISDEFRITTMRVLRVAFLSAFALELITTLSIAIIAVETGLRLLYGHMAFQEAFFILIIAPEFYQPLRNLAVSFHAARAGSEAIDRIYAILDTPLLSVGQGTVTPPTYPYSITFEHIGFTYPGRPSPALKDITLTFQPGQHIAIVGHSGAGKTTLINLLLRFIHPQQGRILIGDTPLASMDARQWRQHIGWVPQNPYLFHASVWENIRLARADATPDDILWAARQAAIDTFIDNLPAGWSTLVGEQGTLLSGGQGQRIAIARAFLKDAPLLIWDEPTANLDPLVETQIIDSMQRLMHNRTVVTIAHRLNTVTQADRIVVLDHGQVVDDGPHRDLLARCEPYRQMVGHYA